VQLATETYFAMVNRRTGGAATQGSTYVLRILLPQSPQQTRQSAPVTVVPQQQGFAATSMSQPLMGVPAYPQVM
jgi:hypothetical protein